MSIIPATLEVKAGGFIYKFKASLGNLTKSYLKIKNKIKRAGGVAKW